MYISWHSLPLFLLMCKVLTWLHLLSALSLQADDKERTIFTLGVLFVDNSKKKKEAMRNSEVENVTGVFFFFLNWLFRLCQKCDQCLVSDRGDLLPAFGRFRIFSASPALTTLVHFVFFFSGKSRRYCQTVLKKKTRSKGTSLKA